MAAEQGELLAYRSPGQPAFAALLKEHRATAGLSQEELAARAGLSARGISDLERGIRRTPQRYTLERLTIALGLTPEEATRFEIAAHLPGPAVSSDG